MCNMAGDCFRSINPLCIVFQRVRICGSGFEELEPSGRPVFGYRGQISLRDLGERERSIQTPGHG